MTTIKTTCASCGDVELGPEDLSLELDPSKNSGSYRFFCPACNTLQRRPANARIVSVLLATGVSYEVLQPEPITEQEIDTFVQNLEDVDDWARLLAS
jgi:hypothetical protein